ncbi:(Fe-S)-binding protein [Allostreptomyces psammosilenae]|uniref:L-lactate dehydrogenase complex protein LldE n=1 Tax=Allostreptomyces psammosilenae TaxID=1892865 RepID=A0A852ZYQ2_9ACTN|nr:(Fe-S)-binding protein [Allostreptomyces psammosilenae]NYI03412.1 L-lactate dehydrogenase complex protein LldE [Allostreptomyces psammosilenae]
MRVGLFLTCVNDTLYPGTGRATVRLLERLGVEVDFPAAQTCCGQMHYNTGYRHDAEPLARRYADTFADYDAIVVPSGSCAAMVRDNYPRLGRRARDEGRGEALAAHLDPVVPKTYELSEFLLDVLGVTDVGAYFPHRVTYHPTCHSSRMLGVGDRPLRLLRAVRGLTLLELPEKEQCCGFGGTFALKNPDVSAAMGTDKARHTIATGAEVLCAADNSCLMHIGGTLNRQRAGVRVMHLAEILASTESEPADPSSAPAAAGARAAGAPCAPAADCAPAAACAPASTTARGGSR